MRWYRSQKVCWDATRPERTRIIFSRVRPLMHRNQLNITFPGENRLLPDTSKTALTLTSYVDGHRVQVTRNNGSCAFSTEIHMNHAVTLWFFSHLLKLHNVTHELYLSFLGYGRQFVCGIGQAHKITERQALNIKTFDRSWKWFAKPSTTGYVVTLTVDILIFQNKTQVVTCTNYEFLSLLGIQSVTS